MSLAHGPSPSSSPRALPRSQSAPAAVRYGQQPQKSTWAQSIYEGAEKIGKGAQYVDWGATAGMMVPEPHTFAVSTAAKAGAKQ